MDIRQLRYFATIAEEGQITRAANKLHMAQPPLSQQLKALEQELGILLVERIGRNIELTDAGKLLYERATDLLNQLDETVMEVKEVGEGIKGVLSIGSVKTCFSYLPDLMRMFRELYPNVTFRLFEGDSFRLSQDLRNRDIEIALVRLPLELDGLSSLPLPIDQFVAVIPEHWSYEKNIPINEFARMPLMLLHRIKGIGLYEMVIEEFKNHELIPNIICQCADAAMLISLVHAGVGATFLPRSTLHSFPTEGLKIIEMDNFIIQSESSLVWLTDRYLSKSTVKFIEMFKKAYQLT